MTDPIGLLACPHCGGALGLNRTIAEFPAGPGLPPLGCPDCARSFCAPGGVPWLFADPEAARSDWRNRYEYARARLAAERARAEAALARARSEPARRRLAGLSTGCAAQDAAVAALLDPVLGSGSGPLESHVALRTALPAGQGLLTYETNVFRDWCWGADEAAATLAAILTVLDGRAPARVLVLGAGAGRLAYDLHQASVASLTFALDINPLLVHVGASVARGGRVELTEFPLAPRRPEDVAIARELIAPGPARPGLQFVLGDVWRPPFRAESFDLVVTPWLLDILDRPIEPLLRRINRLLAPDGLWINHGSNAFSLADPAERLSLEELLQLAEINRLQPVASEVRRMPYLCCPESRHGRLEEVVTFAARRTALLPVTTDAVPAPEWLTSPDQPVPLLPGFQTQALATRTHAYILSLIDGRRSIVDVARVLEQHGLIGAADGQVALQGFFAKLYEEAIRGG